MPDKPSLKEMEEKGYGGSRPEPYAIPRGIGEEIWRNNMGTISGATYTMASAPAGTQTYTAANLGVK